MVGVTESGAGSIRPYDRTRHRAPHHRAVPPTGNTRAPAYPPEVERFTPSTHPTETERNMVAWELEGALILYPSGQIQRVARFDASRDQTLRCVLPVVG